MYTGDAEHSSLRCGALLEGLAELQRGEGRLQGWAEQGWAEQGWAGPDSTGTSRSMLGGVVFSVSAVTGPGLLLVHTGLAEG